MPVLEFPVVEEGGPGGLKEGEKDEEEKNEDGDDEDEMEGKRRDDEDMLDNLVVEECMIVKVPLCPFCYLSPSHAASA